VLLKLIKVHSSSDTIIKYMDAFGVGSDEDYCLRHKHNYTIYMCEITFLI
jgi:hypothetical protein